MFTLQFGQTTKARNSTFVPPINGAATPVLLREETSIVTPTFRMRLEYEGMCTAEELFQYNYCYCEQFKRYYFITNITSITAVIFDIECICDVLATFREEILETDAFVMFAESKYNSMIPDSRLPISDRSEMYVVTQDTTLCDDDGCYILTLASESGTGETGAAQSYALSKEQMRQVSSVLYSSNFWEAVVQVLTNPLDAIIACKWVPLKKSHCSVGGDIPITIGGFSIGAGSAAKRTGSGSAIYTPHVHYKSQVWNPITESYEYSWADYRNVEPYSEYSIWLPGVGLTQIPMINIIGDGGEEPKIEINYSYSPCTGDITYNINRFNDVNLASGNGMTESTILTVKGNFSVDIPVASGSRGYANGIGNVAMFAGSVIAATSGSPYAAIHVANAIGSGIEAVKAIGMQTSVSGSLGGWASIEDMYTHISIYTTVFEISDAPSNITNVIGRPLYKRGKLKDFNGLVKCTGAYVNTWATEQEHQMIAQYVNSSTNFIFGGLIIE